LETLVLSFTNFVTGTVQQETLSIVDDDTGIEFENASVSINEESGQLVLGIRRQDDSTESATVNFATVDGTARAGEDYEAVAGMLTFASGQNRKEIMVPISNDTAREPVFRPVEQRHWRICPGRIDRSRR
jgi:hypothetical protein